MRVNIKNVGSKIGIKQHLSRFRRWRYAKPLTILGFVLVFGGLGSYFLFPSRANTGLYVLPDSIAGTCDVNRKSTSADVTAAINNFINSVPDGIEGAPNTIQFGANKCYRIDGTLMNPTSSTSPVAVGRKHLIFEGNNSVLDASKYVPSPSPKIEHSILQAKSGFNLTFQNFTLYGQHPNPCNLDASGNCRDGGAVAAYEWYYGFAFLGGQDLTVRNNKIYNVYGDGIILAQGPKSGQRDPQTNEPLWGNDPVKQALVENNLIDGTGRHGMGVTGVDGVVIRNNTFDRISYQVVDMEYEAFQPVRNVTYVGNTLKRHYLSFLVSTTGGEAGVCPPEGFNSNHVIVGNIMTVGGVTVNMPIWEASTQASCPLPDKKDIRIEGNTLIYNHAETTNSAIQLDRFIGSVKVFNNRFIQPDQVVGPVRIRDSNVVTTVKSNDGRESPWAYSVNGVNHASGVDACGNTTSQGTSKPVACSTAVPATPNDTTAPTASITSPSGGSTVKGIVKLTASASDNYEVNRVTFMVDGIAKETDTSAPYEFNLDARVYDYGTHKIEARAYDVHGNRGSSAPVTVTVDNGTFWNTTYQPVFDSASDSLATELGLKFKSDVSGSVTGLRFHKGPNNTGTHVGSIWNSTGQRLAQVTFANETAKGWQEARFSTPVAITAGQTYIVSYHAPNGRYSIDIGYFTNKSRDQGALHAPASQTSGGNGVYAHGPAGTFPTQIPPGWPDPNFWVDILFTPSGTTPPPSDSTPPTTSITAPINGATVAGTININATATDNVAVTKTDFLVDGVVKGTDTTASDGWTNPWNTTTVPNGSHTLTTKAYDAAGNVGTSSTVTVSVSNSTTSTTPTVAITSPTNGATIAGSVVISANATDDKAVTRVEFSIDGVLRGTIFTPPYAIEWGTTNTPNGSHTLTARAYDADGNIGSSPTVTITVSNNTSDTTPPSTPANLTATAVSSSQINLAWTASTDNIGVSGYDVYRNGTLIATVTSTSFGNTGLSASSTYTYHVIARDAAGNSSSASNSVSATTQSTAPITYGTLAGTVKSSNGSNLAGAKVNFTVNGSKRTLVTNSLGQYSLSNIPAGTYSVKYSAQQHNAQTLSVSITANSTTIQDVTLVRR